MTAHKLRRHALMIVMFVALGLAITPTSIVATETPGLSVYFFDVGQGDAILFQGSDFTILIDAGRHDRSDVIPHLQSVGVDFIDLFIGTHPHADHIGQCEHVMTQFTVREVWLSGDVHTTRNFERCIDAILASDAAYYEPRAGESFQIGSAHIEVVHPKEVTGDLNNGSVAVRIVYGAVSFLLTGDAEMEAERAMLARDHVLEAQILKLGHHGSRTSSTTQFLEAVNPEVAIYSAGKDNSYGHPHVEILQRSAWMDIPLYGTDTHGTIKIDTDGHSYRIVTESDGPLTQPPVIEDTCTLGQIDLNAAPQAQLTQIIHIGPVLAERIVSERPFYSIDDLTRVAGIGAARLAEIKAQGLACVGAIE